MTVQRVETTIDNFGGETQTYTDRYLDVWCQPLPIGSSAAGGGEYSDDAQMQADAKYEFVCRYLPGVEYTDRIFWSGGYFDIYQIFPIGRREGMRIRGSWSDNQDDAWSMGGLNAEQVVSGTGGLTLSQVTAEYEANDTGQTFAELVEFYNDNSLPTAPQIAYPSIPHMDISADTTTEWGPNSYTGQLAAGLYTQTQPEYILHIAEIDYAADPDKLSRLTHNNEFGNKFRFTYDDGTEATEVNSTSQDALTGVSTSAGPGGDGYAGDNPQYIIDHLTGLGFWRPSYAVTSTTVDDTNWWEAKGLYDVFSDWQDFIDRPSSITLAGYSDWRRMTWAEFTYSLGNMDNVNWMANTSNHSNDVYFPPLNASIRGLGGSVILSGPVSGSHSSDGFNNDGTSVTAWNMLRAQPSQNYLSLVSESTVESMFAAGNNNTYAPGALLCRRHYDNT